MRIFFFIFCLLFSVGAGAQITYVTKQLTKAELEAERKRNQDALNDIQRELDEVKNSKRATMGELSALQNKLAYRQRLIGNINEELGDIDNTIKSSSKEIMTMKQKLEHLKIRYAQSIRYSYATRSSYDMLAFLFSSRDFNDVMRRMKYLKKFRDFRKAQVEQIRTMQGQLQHKIGKLNEEKQEQSQLLTAQEKEKVNLLAETEKTNQVMQELKGKEGELLKKIEKNKQVQQRINNYIKAQIEKEMEEAARRADEEKKKAEAAKKALAAATAAANAKPATKPNVTTDNSAVKNLPRVEPKIKEPEERESPNLLLAPNEVELANNFEGNKGRLYWPVEKGYITDHFGQHPHPLEPKVLIENNGIDIQTVASADVKAVFEGIVSKVFSTVGSSQIVMIQHGNYFTVYNGLSSVSVKTGQHVNVRQVIGQVANNDNDVPTLNFQIWKSNGKKSNVKLNPEQWIGRAH